MLLNREGHWPGLAHHSAGVQHPALSSTLKFAIFKQKSINRVSPVSWLGNAEAEQEAEVTISSQLARWSSAIATLQLSLAGRHSSRALQCIPQLRRIPKFPIAARLSSSSIPTALSLFSIMGLFFFFIIFFFLANWPEATRSQLNRVFHLLCRSSKRCSAEHHSHIYTTTLAAAPRSSFWLPNTKPSLLLHPPVIQWLRSSII